MYLYNVCKCETSSHRYMNAILNGTIISMVLMNVRGELTTGKEVEEGMTPFNVMNICQSSKA